MSKIDQHIQKLENQRLKLESDLTALKRQRNEDILSVMDAFPEGTACSNTLIGLFLEGLETTSKDPQKAEVWRQAGDIFCKRKRPKRGPQQTRSSLKKNTESVSENE